MEKRTFQEQGQAKSPKAGKQSTVPRTERLMVLEWAELWRAQYERLALGHDMVEEAGIQSTHGKVGHEQNEEHRSSCQEGKRKGCV